MTGKSRALIIDDSSATRMILKEIVVQHGFDTVEAENGKEALRQLGLYDDIRLALVDWNMPEMNGLEFVIEARKESKFDGVVMMMVTTETEMDKVRAALQAGADEYVMKPFTREVLAEKLTLLGMKGETG